MSSIFVVVGVARQCGGGHGQTSLSTATYLLRQFFFNSFQLRLELLIDDAEAGFDAATAGSDLGIGVQFGARKRGDFVDEHAHLIAQRLEIVGIELDSQLRTARRQFQRLAHQGRA